MDALRLAQISDTHVRADDGGAASAALRRAMAQAGAYNVDAILLTGDLVNDERSDEYAALAEAIADSPAPIYLLPGNHDNRAAIRAAFPGHTYLPRQGALSYVIEDYPIRIVMLDQIAPGQVHGDFSVECADWLQAALSRAPNAPTLVALHHPPFRTHDLLFDTIGLRGAARFAEVIAAHKQVVRIVCGHHHRVAMGQVAHAPVIIAPSSSWVYGLALDGGQEIAPKTGEQPGWMLHAWTRGGGFASHFMGI